MNQKTNAKNEPAANVPVEAIVHTPGPWYAHMNGEGSFCIKAGTDYDISPTLASRSKWKSDAERSNANARLIAAAPELLEALEDCLRWIEADEWTYGRTFSTGDRIRTAIEKATGVRPAEVV